jgi:putative spermidine/putrescine transport system substrate-binding protein/spermidine/putrescine transport system substrate-binding protein
LRLSLLAVMIAAAAAFLAACGGSDDSSSASGESTGGGEETTASLSGDPKACSALNLYTWEGEGGPELVKPFEEEWGVPVKVSYMTSAAEAIAKLAAGGTKQYDLIVAGSEISQPMKEAGVIKPIDTSLIEEYDELFPFTTEPFEIEGETWGIAADWGVNPFIYSTELVKTPPTEWADLWKPEMKGLVSLWEDISLIWVGASALGMDDDPDQLFELSQEQLDEIRDKMLELKGNVRKMWSSGGDLIQLYANGEVGASMGWSYVINELRAQNEPVEEGKLKSMGAQAWSEGPAMSVDIDPDCEAAAYEWINYEVSPKGQAALAAESTYTPTNPGAAKFMDKDLIELTGLDDPKGFLGSAIFKEAPADPEAYNQTLQEIIAGLS